MTLHSGTLTAHYAKSMNSTLDEPLVAIDRDGQLVATAKEEECSPAASHAPSRLVRRLTPVECERLQGFPDGHTEGESDSARYRMLGNAVAVPVVEWIAKRLVEVDERVKSGSSRENDS